MTHNPILDELYAIRERLLADAGGDLQKFLAGVRDREAASGRLLEREGEDESEPDPSLTTVAADPLRGPLNRGVSQRSRRCSTARSVVPQPLVREASCRKCGADLRSAASKPGSGCLGPCGPSDRQRGCRVGQNEPWAVHRG